MQLRNQLHTMNPALKFLIVVISMLTLAWFFNPWTPFLFFIGILTVQVVLSSVKWKLWLLLMIPFSITAIGYLWTTVLFAADTGGTIIWTWNSIEVTDEQLSRALSLALRVIAFSAISLLFVLTTQPVTFIMSLMQQFRLSPKLAYSILVGYQFLPVIKEEFIQIRHAHRLRGVGMEKWWWQRLLGMRRMLIPLLAAAVRKAERSAFAMEARGFTGQPRTAFFKPVPVRLHDWVLVALFMTILTASCLLGVLWT
ncbi:energy-coupling factor transporter transmembrane component T family protein [Sporosarcina sp. NPDC096371]|uniref:energy-coupling factor transporter transmembrane component T family protein n=1 Tax=Sporosarcina sp. NPDC096371 TaxID=3364530 RepID=UPI0037F3C606